MDKFVRVLRKEFSRNWKKSALLGVMCVVALYFWAPLIWKSISGSKPERAVAARPGGTTSRTTTRPATAAQHAENNRQIKPGWKTLVRWMDQDPYMSAAALGATVRNPFQDRRTPELVAAEPRPEQMLVSLEQLRLTLNGTFVGGRYRVATINGKTFHEQARIQVHNGKVSSPPSRGALQGIQYTIHEIQPRYVILEREGKMYSLSIRGAELGDSGQITTDRRFASQD